MLINHEDGKEDGQDDGQEAETDSPRPTTWEALRKLRKLCQDERLIPNHAPRFEEAPPLLRLDPSDDSAEGALNNLLLVRTMLRPIDQGYIVGAPSHEDLDFMCFCVGHLIQLAGGFVSHSSSLKSVVAMSACLSAAQTALGILFTALCEAKSD